MITYKACPVCESETITDCFVAEDYTVSHEIFSVWECSNCTHLFTQNIPAQNEIGKYYKSENYISHTDTQTGIINRLYHLVRKKTLNGKLHLIQKETDKQTGKILDIGCGTGAFLHHMKIAGWESTGLEPDETARKKQQSCIILIHSLQMNYSICPIIHTMLLPCGMCWSMCTSCMDM